MYQEYIWYISVAQLWTKIKTYNKIWYINSQALKIYSYMYLHVFTSIEKFFIEGIFNGRYSLRSLPFQYGITTNIKQKESRYILKDKAYICFPKKWVVLRFAKDTNCVWSKHFLYLETATMSCKYFLHISFTKRKGCLKTMTYV